MKPIYHRESLSTQSFSKLFSGRTAPELCVTLGWEQGGFLWPCHWLSRPLSQLGWTWICPSHRTEVWSFLFVQSARLFRENQFIFTWQASFSKLFSWNEVLTYLGSVLVPRLESLKLRDHWNSLRLPLNTPLGLFQTLDFFLNLSKDYRGYFLTFS